MPRKQKKYHFIYKTTNLMNNKYYIGMHSTDNLDDGYISSGKKLWSSINKYGKENHSVIILEYLSNRELLKDREKTIVNKELLNDKMCMNLVIGGEGGRGFTSKEAKKGRLATDKILFDKYGENFRSIIINNYFNTLTDIGRINRSNKIKDGLLKINFKHNNFDGKKHTEDTKRIIGEKNSINQKGEKNSQFGTCWIYNSDKKINKKIKKEELNKWIELGWNKGRKIKQ